MRGDYFSVCVIRMKMRNIQKYLKLTGQMLISCSCLNEVAVCYEVISGVFCFLLFSIPGLMFWSGHKMLFFCFDLKTNKANQVSVSL